MITGKEFEQTVYGYWANRFGCAQEDFFRPGILIIKEDNLAKTDKMHVYHIDKMIVVRTDPALADQAGWPGGYRRGAVWPSGRDFEQLFGEQAQVTLVSTLLDCFLDPNDFKQFTGDHPFSARRVDPQADEACLLELYEACSEADLDDAEIYVDDPDPVIFGLFDGPKMIAYASHRYWDDVLADIGVLIHPDYRRRGLGKAVVSVLCEWCFENDVVPMYRVFDDHLHSIKIRQALGFKQLVAIQSFKITA